MNRRQFVGGLTFGGLAAGLGGALWWRRKPTAVAPATVGEGRLPAQHLKTLTALTNTLMPTYQNYPAAENAGVMTYIQGQATSEKQPGLRLLLMRGASASDKLAVSLYRKTTSLLSDEERYALVSALFDGQGSLSGLSTQEFVTTLLALTLEGYLGDPVYGGNLNEVGWTLASASPTGPRPTACLAGHCSGEDGK